MTQEINQQEWKEFCEWCGFRNYRGHSNIWVEPGVKIYDNVNDKIVRGLPPLDLNNLFKYAVPKILEKVGKLETVALVNNVVCDAVESGGEITNSLYQAIQKAREVTKNERQD